eukprot:TRINITY_DN102082_c0_g1_i1.p1 TRINITY_DN102082_c0_g1~~TRINITY_DN102082_c0_g1_i1.p1  ORF type:complete len:388 (-),score=98.20 TRINITY_DN102082_c0_g1_i1:98-1195(-)
MPAGDGSADAPPRLEEEEDEAGVDEKDLFGDDGEEADEQDLFGSEDELDVDEKDLFGDEDEETGTLPATPRPSTGGATPGTAPGIGQTPVPPSYSHEDMLSEMDEKEIFGEISDEEDLPGDQRADVILLRRPAPTRERPIISIRLPNVLSIETKAFNPRNVSGALLEGYKEGIDTTGKQVLKLMTPGNCIRWRFKKGADGQCLTDEDGRPQYESNGRIVEWEDGSRTLFIGEETFTLNEMKDTVLLYEENSADVHICHGVMHQRLSVQPKSLNSETHERLKRSQYRKYEPVRRTLLMSAEEQAESQQMLQLELEQKKRQEKQTAKQKRTADALPGMNQEFLEADDGETPGGVGPSIKDVKRARTS